MGAFKLKYELKEFSNGDQLRPDQMHIESSKGIILGKGVKFLLERNYKIITCSEKITIKGFKMDDKGNFVITNMNGDDIIYDVNKDFESNLIGQRPYNSDFSDTE